MSLILGDNFDYKASKPLDGRLKYDTLASMIAVADSTMYDGCLAYCVATDKTYQWKSTNEVDPILRKWREFTSGGNIQLEELPEASADELDNIYMYMGADDSTEGLVHAHFYQCVSDGGSPATYSWKDMGYQKIYVGHKADWDLLSVAEKIEYDEAHFDDDEGREAIPTNMPKIIKKIASLNSYSENVGSLQFTGVAKGTYMLWIWQQVQSNNQEIVRFGISVNDVSQAQCGWEGAIGSGSWKNFPLTTLINVDADNSTVKCTFNGTIAKANMVLINILDVSD